MDKPISVKLQPKTIERLRKEKHTGQSWDGLVNEIMDEVGELRALVITVKDKSH